jgi:hypothetical protein|tara:strand:- start:252 stop:542 length:291 start_codon:yes stop_codon:yes gene_type:complete
MKLVVSKSNLKSKKLKAVFTDDKGNTTTTHFGAKGMSDYTINKDKERRKRYRDRHKKDLNTGDYKRAGYLSYYILWGDKTNIPDAVKDYKRRFKLS